MSLIETLRAVLVELQLPGAEVYLHSRFSSDENDHRTLLREAIYDNLISAFSRESRSKILLLDRVPRPEAGYLSIAHCRGWGGYIYSTKPVGFDIEVASRIAPEIIERIATKAEIEESPHFQLLWPAKEACFKSLIGFSQPNTVSEIKIETWRKHNQGSRDAYHSKYNAFLLPQKRLIVGRGIAGQTGNHVWSVFSHDETM